ncbi:MAG: aspartate/glutamate racemase family protein [Acidobacteriota bacterium]
MRSERKRSVSPALGIIDWGIGGIGVYKQIKALAPERSVIYFSDTGATPYGRMRRPELVARLKLVIEFMRSRGVDQVLIACNAASTAIPYLGPGDLNIEGMIDTAVEITCRYRPERLGLIGGRRTVLSSVYRKAFAKRGVSVSQRIAQPLSALIESGDTSSDRLHNECRKILKPMRSCSHILLACTHYPAILPVLKEHVAPTTIFVDPSTALAEKYRTGKGSDAAPDRFFTTGDPVQMKDSATKAFGCVIAKPLKISI